LKDQPLTGRTYRTWLLLFCLICAFALYTANLHNNPPGFYLDESSIAFNAHSIAQNGTSEYGSRWPLFFRSFGDFKSPIYIYLLAAVFKFSGPSITVARFLSATLGFVTALLLGLLASRLYGARRIGTFLFVALTALLTPWLFEISRLVFEVALCPLAIVLFLIAVHRAQSKPKWSSLDSLAIAITLSLITYSYTIGRLLGPLLAVGITVFVNAGRWRAIIQTWIACVIAWIPIFIFNQRSSEAFTNRFAELSYLGSSGKTEIATQFIGHYLHNLSLWSLLVDGDLNPRHHIRGMGSILFPTLILAVVGLAITLYRHWRDPWWRFVLYGLVASIIPAALTKDDFHTLRLAAFPVFLLLLTVPALEWLFIRSSTSTPWRIVLITLVGLTVLQAGVFQWQYQRLGPKRTGEFEAEYPRVLNAAIAQSERPIYLVDEGYAHGYWYGVLQGLDPSDFKRDEHPPSGALVIAFKKGQTRGQIIFEGDVYVVYRAF
jgi:hypothetical protein